MKPAFKLVLILLVLTAAIAVDAESTEFPFVSELLAAGGNTVVVDVRMTEQVYRTVVITDGVARAFSPDWGPIDGAAVSDDGRYIMVFTTGYPERGQFTMIDTATEPWLVVPLNDLSDVINVHYGHDGINWSEGNFVLEFTQYEYFWVNGVVDNTPISTIYRYDPVSANLSDTEVYEGGYIRTLWDNGALVSYADGTILSVEMFGEEPVVLNPNDKDRHFVYNWQGVVYEQDSSAGLYDDDGHWFSLSPHGFEYSRIVVQGDRLMYTREEAGTTKLLEWRQTGEVGTEVVLGGFRSGVGYQVIATGDELYLPSNGDLFVIHKDDTMAEIAIPELGLEIPSLSELANN